MPVKRSYLLIVLSIIVFFTLKLWLNGFLMAENGDTYNFFEMALSIKNGDFMLDSKRMPLFPLLLSVSPVEYFETFGHILVNLFYIGSILLFFYDAKFYLKDRRWVFLATLMFATNMIIVDNSFYIMSDALFTFIFLLFLAVYNRSKGNPGTKDILYLFILSALAFYTRPEGILLLGVLGLKLLQSKKYKQVLALFLLGCITVSPVFLKNSAAIEYMSDKAGFNINVRNLYMGICLLLFGIGGVWLLPLLTFTRNRISIKLRSLSLESLVFVSFGLILVLWGPYIRLYSVPVTLLILFATRALERPEKPASNFLKVLGALTVGLFIYLVAVQIFDQRDLGMFKLSKGMTVLFSGSATLCMYLYARHREFKYALLFVFSVVVINLMVFTERFVYTRHKYLTIVEAANYYINNLPKEGILGYSDESGVEKWYLRDYDILQYSSSDPKGWLEQNNVRYFLSTKEMGDSSEAEKQLKKYLKDYPVVKVFESPGYGGYSEIVNITSADL